MSKYNNYGIFRWNVENSLYSNENNNYNNVYLNTGTVVKGQWENPICLTKTDNTINVISNSNHFLHGHEWGTGYNYTYKIFDNLVRNYTNILNAQEQNINYELHNDNTYFYMLDAFSFSNSGHNLSNILNMAQYILNNNIKNILIFKNYKNTNNFKLIELLLPINCNFIELNENLIYKIKNITIIYPEIFNILKHTNLIHKLKNKIAEDYSVLYNNCKNKNIILMKTNRNKNVMLEHTRVKCEKLLLMLEEQNYINLIPEEIDIFNLCIYIMYANKIIISDGSVIYTNKIFINDNTKLFGIVPGENRSSCFSGLKSITYLSYKNNILTDSECMDFYDSIVN